MELKKNLMLERCMHNLYSHLKNADYDEFFTWEQLEGMAAASDKLTKQQLYYVVNKTNEMLLFEDRKCLATISGVGKRVMRPEEHREAARKRVRTSVSAYKRAGAILAATNLDRLSEDEKSKVVMDMNKWRNLQMLTEEAIKSSRKKVEGSGRSKVVWQDAFGDN